jgi:predicted metal-dependent phosphoesterase TrpH
MFKYELHMHTIEGSACGQSLAREQVYAYHKAGYAGIVITDHFINGNSSYNIDKAWGGDGGPESWEEKMEFVRAGYLAAQEAGDKVGLDVFFGWEFSNAVMQDFVTYGLDWDFLMANPNIHRLPIEAYSKLVRDAGGFIAQVHPFRGRGYVKAPYPVDPSLIDAVEVFNASDEPENWNEKALAFAKEHDLPMQAGTDSHHMDLIHMPQPFRSGITLKERAKDIHDIIEAIKNKEVELILP